MSSDRQAGRQAGRQTDRQTGDELHIKGERLFEGERKLSFRLKRSPSVYHPPPFYIYLVGNALRAYASGYSILDFTCVPSSVKFENEKSSQGSTSFIK